MDLHLEIGPGPRRTQLEAQLRDGVRTGRLRAGTRLPPSRELARALGVSRGVVVDAYAQLVAEGWLTARQGRGTEVAGHPVSRAAARSPGGAAQHAPAPVRFDLRTGRPDLAAFPRAAWGAAIGRALKTLPDEALGYGDPRGLAALREALASQLGRTRGVLADPARVVVCGGLYAGLQVLWRALAAHGVRRVAVEEPGWRGQWRSVAIAQLEAVPVPVDDHGLVTDDLDELDVQAVCVTPAHQWPLGGVLAPERRAALLDWAHRTHGLVVEDDYDAEYRYDREPVGALQGLSPDRVVYAGSASKTLAPALRLGWLVVPAHLAADVATAKDLTDRGTPVLEQAALADLLDRGEIDRHLRRTRRTYRARRDALVAALAEQLPEARIGGVAAGLHVVAHLPPGTDAPALRDAAAARGVAVEALADPPALLLGYAALPEAGLRRAVELLRQASSGRACAARGTR